MNSDYIKKAILEKKPIGVRYIHSHKTLIKALISEGESIGSIYVALKETDCPPPISKSQFYRHIKNLNLVKKSLLSEKNTSATKKESNPKHDAVNNTTTNRDPIHDNAIDADNLI